MLKNRFAARIIRAAVAGTVMALAVTTGAQARQAENKPAENKESKTAAPAQEALWSKQCLKDPAGKDICFVQQFAIATQQKAVMLNVAFGYLGPEGKPRIILTAPLGILLVPGVQMTIDNGKPIVLPFDNCQPSGCRAAVDLDKQALDQFRNGKVLAVRYAMMDRKAIDIPIKLDGLDKALKSVAP